jgi:hypothetical protein
MMLPVARVCSSVGDVHSSMCMLCACTHCRRIEHKCAGSLLRYARVCLSVVEVELSVLARTGFSKL